MADTMDDVKRQVSEVGKNLRDAYTFKNARESASRAIESGKKAVRDWARSNLPPVARKALSSRKSSGRSRSR